MARTFTNLIYLIVIQSLFNVSYGAEVSGSEYKNIFMEIKESIAKEMKEEMDKRIDMATRQLKNDFVKLAEKVNKIEIKVSQIMEVTFTNPHTDTKNVIEPKAKLNNTSELEDRVEILELEVSFLQTALDGVADEVDDLQADQTSQDNRMNNLEGDINDLEDEVNSLESGYVDLLMRVDTAEEDIILHREQINVLDNRDDLFDEELTLLDGRVTQLEGFTQDNTQRLEAVEHLANVTNMDVETLEVIVENHDAEITQLDNNVTDAFDEISAVRFSVKDNQMDIRELDDRLGSVETVVSSETIAFHAYLDGPATMPDQIIVYDIIVLNSGNLYNSSSGVFTVNQHGIYLFTMSIRNSRSGTAHDRFLLRKNGVSYCVPITDSESTTSVYVDTSCTVIMEAYPGDEIYVYADATADSLIGSSIQNYFSGMLVRGLAN